MIDESRGPARTENTQVRGGVGLRSPAYALFEHLDAEAAAVEATGRAAGAALIPGYEETISTFEEGQIVRCQVAEELLPHVVHHPLAHVLRREGVAEVEQETQDHGDDIRCGDAVQTGEVLGYDVPVDGDLDEVRLRERRGASSEDRDEGSHDLAAVRTEIRQQTPHQPGVVGSAEDVLLLERHYEAASSSSSSCFRCRAA